MRERADRVTCTVCHGSGYSPLSRRCDEWDVDCRNCHGTGEVLRYKPRPEQVDWHWQEAETVELRS